MFDLKYFLFLILLRNNGESICFFFWILISFLILRSLLCIVKIGFAIDLWWLFIIVNALYLYKANVWTFDSCHNSVYGLSEKKNLLKLCGWCCAFSSFHTIFGKMTGNKYQSKCESTKYSPYCVMLWPAWMGIALLRCSALLIQWLIMTPRQSYFLLFFNEL